LRVPVAVIVLAPGGGRRSLCGRRGASSLLSQSVLLHPGGTRACQESFCTIARQSARASVGSAGVHGPQAAPGAGLSACPRGGSAVTTPCSTRARYILDSVSRTVRDYRDMPVCAALGLIFLLVGSASCFDVGVLCFRVLDSVCAPTTVSPPGGPAHGRSVPSCGACGHRCGVASPP
jgi:hypothetical protein